MLIYPSYPRFVAQTDTAGEAFGAFLTCCVKSQYSAIPSTLCSKATAFEVWSTTIGSRQRGTKCVAQAAWPKT